MGVQVRTGNGNGNTAFVTFNAKEGVFTVSEKGNKTKHAPGDVAISGVITGFSVEEKEFEGQKREVLLLTLRDGDSRMQLETTLNTDANGVVGASLRALTALNKCDLSKPVSFRAYCVKAGEKLGDKVFEKDMPGMTVYQGEPAGANKVQPDALPKLEPVMANGRVVKQGNKEVLDKSPWSDMLESNLNALAQKFGAAPADADTDHGDVDMDDAAAAAQQATRPRATA